MPITDPVRAYNCKLLYSAAGVGTPTWVEVPGVEDVTLTTTFDSDDVNIRQMGGAKAAEPTLVDYQVEFSVPFDEGDTTRKAFITAALARTALGIACMSSGDGTTTGSQGLKADMKFFTMTREELVGKVARQKFTLKPCLSATAPWYGTVA